MAGMPYSGYRLFSRADSAFADAGGGFAAGVGDRMRAQRKAAAFENANFRRFNFFDVFAVPFLSP